MNTTHEIRQHIHNTFNFFATFDHEGVHALLFFEPMESLL